MLVEQLADARVDRRPAARPASRAAGGLDHAAVERDEPPRPCAPRRRSRCWRCRDRCRGRSCRTGDSAPRPGRLPGVTPAQHRGARRGIACPPARRPRRRRSRMSATTRRRFLAGRRRRLRRRRASPRRAALARSAAAARSGSCTSPTRHVRRWIPRSEPADAPGAASSDCATARPRAPVGRRDLDALYAEQGRRSTAQWAAHERIYDGVRTPVAHVIGNHDCWTGRGLGRPIRTAARPRAAQLGLHVELLRAAARRLEADRARLDRADGRRRLRRPPRRRADGLAAARARATPRRPTSCSPRTSRSRPRCRSPTRCARTTARSSSRRLGRALRPPELNDLFLRHPTSARAQRPQPHPRRHHLQHVRFALRRRGQRQLVGRGRPGLPRHAGRLRDRRPVPRRLVRDPLPVLPRGRGARCPRRRA